MPQFPIEEYARARGYQLEQEKQQNEAPAMAWTSFLTNAMNQYMTQKTEQIKWQAELDKAYAVEKYKMMGEKEKQTREGVRKYLELLSTGQISAEKPITRQLPVLPAGMRAMGQPGIPPKTEAVPARYEPVSSPEDYLALAKAWGGQEEMTPETKLMRVEPFGQYKQYQLDIKRQQLEVRRQQITVAKSDMQFQQAATYTKQAEDILKDDPTNEKATKDRDEGFAKMTARFNNMHPENPMTQYEMEDYIAQVPTGWGPWEGTKEVTKQRLVSKQPSAKQPGGAPAPAKKGSANYQRAVNWLKQHNASTDDDNIKAVIGKFGW